MPQARLLYASRIHFASRKFNTFHGNSLNPTDTTNYSLFSHGFFETNPYAEIITKRTSNDRKITHPKSTGRKPECKTLHPATVQNEQHRYTNPTVSQSERCIPCWVAERINSSRCLTVSHSWSSYKNQSQPFCHQIWHTCCA